MACVVVFVRKSLSEKYLTNRIGFHSILKSFFFVFPPPFSLPLDPDRGDEMRMVET